MDWWLWMPIKICRVSNFSTKASNLVSFFAWLAIIRGNISSIIWSLRIYGNQVEWPQIILSFKAFRCPLAETTLTKLKVSRRFDFLDTKMQLFRKILVKTQKPIWIKVFWTFFPCIIQLKINLFNFMKKLHSTKMSTKCNKFVHVF